MHMTEQEFEDQLRADGYLDIERQELASRPGKDKHRHVFAIRGLVISGSFIVAQMNEAVTYGPGEIFSVEHGALHDEWIGPEGATVIVGRKHTRNETG